MKKFSFAVVAMATALAFVPAAVASNVCPNSGLTGGNDNTITNVSGSQDGVCGANSAVNLYVGNVQADYAKVTWTPGTPGIPADLTLGGLTGIDSSVVNSGTSGDQPFYMISFNAPTLGLGQTDPSDQILMLEFPGPAVSGTDMNMSAGTTLFNMRDNISGVYLNGGQAVVNTLDGWFAEYAGLSSESITGIRIGIGLAGGCGASCTENTLIDSVDVNPTVSAPESSSLPMLFLSGFVLFGAIFLKGRQSGLFLAA